jgi:hypothetical protein
MADDKIKKSIKDLTEVAVAERADAAAAAVAGKVAAPRTDEKTRLRTDLRKELIKETMADKLVPWFMLIVIGPLLIFLVGVLAKIHTFERGDLYIYDLGLLLAGTADVLTPREVPHRRRQAFSVMGLLLGIALAVFWSVTGTHGNSGLGARWWPAVVATIFTGIVALTGVYLGADGTARSEVKRWEL